MYSPGGSPFPGVYPGRESRNEGWGWGGGRHQVEVGEGQGWAHLALEGSCPLLGLGRDRWRLSDRWTPFCPFSFPGPNSLPHGTL